MYNEHMDETIVGKIKSIKQSAFAVLEGVPFLNHVQEEIEDINEIINTPLMVLKFDSVNRIEPTTINATTELCRYPATLRTTLIYSLN